MSRKRTPDSRWILYLSLALSLAAFAIGIGGMVTVGPWHMRQFGTGAFKDVTGGIQSLITAAGVVVGGTWAYFKFVRGRTYHPRLSIDLACQWRIIDETHVLHVRVRVTNIGASMVALNQYGSGLQVAVPDGSLRNEIEWKTVQVKSDDQDVDLSFSVLQEHEWIEPGETVSDDLLLDLGRPPVICRLQLTLLWALSADHVGEYNPDDIEVFARRIVAPEELLIDKMPSGKAS